MNAWRTASLVGCASIAAAVGWTASKRSHQRSLPVDRAYAVERTRAELAEAARIGIDSAPVETDLTAPLRDALGPQLVALPLELGERECVAVSAAAYDAARLDDLSLRVGEPGDLTRAVYQQPSGELVAQVQWCTLAAGPARVDVTLSRRPFTDASASLRVHIAVARGAWSRVGGPSALTRGEQVDAWVAQLARTYPDDAFAAVAPRPDGGVALAPPVMAREGAALLVPASARTYDALYRASARDAGVAVDPRAEAVELGIDSGAPRAGARAAHARPAFDPADERARLRPDGSVDPSPHDPVVDLARNDFHRVLAVVDPQAFGAPCMTVTFTRAVPLLAARVAAFDLSTWRARWLVPHDNTATDTLCPSPGDPVVYIADDTDQADYRVGFFAP